jgi:hypothetical protein
MNCFCHLSTFDREFGASEAPPFLEVIGLLLVVFVLTCAVDTARVGGHEDAAVFHPRGEMMKRVLLLSHAV